MFRNARSERRGGLQWFLVSEARSLPILFAAPCKKDPLCHIAFFNSFSKSSWTSVNSTTIKFVRGQNLFLSEKKGSRKDFSQKRIRSWEAQLFHTPFWALRALKVIFYLGGKRFQCPGQGNTLTLDYRKKDFKRIHSERAFRNAKRYRRNMLRSENRVPKLQWIIIMFVGSIGHKWWRYPVSGRIQFYLHDGWSYSHDQEN